MAREVFIPGDRPFTAHGSHWGPGQVKISTGNSDTDDEIADTLEGAVSRVNGERERAEEERNEALESRFSELMKMTKADLVSMVEEDEELGASIDNPTNLRKDHLARSIAQAEQENAPE